MRLDPHSQLSHLICENNPLRAAQDSLSDRWPLDTSPVTAVAQRGAPLVIPDAQQARDFPQYQQDAHLWGYRTVVILPLSCRYDGQQAMVLSVQSVDQTNVDELELNFLSAFSQIASAAIERAQSLQKERDLARRLSAAAQARADLVSLILSDASPGEVASEISSLLKSPLIFYDQSQASPILATDGGRTKELSSAQSVVIATQFRGIDPSGAPEQFSMHLPEIEAGAFQSATAYPLRVGSLFAGALIIGSEDGANLDVIDELNLQEAKFVSAILLMKSLTKFQAVHETASDLLLTIFDGNWRNREALIARGQALGMDLSSPQVFFGIQGFADTDIGKHAEHQALSRTCKRLGISAPIIRDGEIYLIMARLSNTTRPSTDLWANQLLTTMKPLWGKYAGVVISRVCETLEDHANARREIDEALKLSQTFQRFGLIRVTDFGSYGVLLTASGHTRIEAFIERILNPLAAYDEQKRAEALRTIKCYIDNGCKFQPSAEQLGVHVTTLRYRIERIQDIFDIDFSDADTRFDFDLALRLRQFASYPANSETDAVKSSD